MRDVQARLANLLGAMMFHLVLVMWGSCLAQAAGSCDAPQPCTVQSGTYFARTPSHWDGKSPLKTVVFFHGYDSSADAMMQDADLARTLSEANILLVAPQGQMDPRGIRTWSFPGKLVDHGRDDFAFVQEVVADVLQRWPVDRAHLMAAGFSVGGSMTWYVACNSPRVFAGFAPIAGDFWVPEPDICPAGPATLRHVHGTADETVPLAGRSLRGGLYQQGNLAHGISTWQHINGCDDSQVVPNQQGELSCRTWPATTCTSHHALAVCLHPGGHIYQAAWVVQAMQWLDRQHPDKQP